MKQKPDAVLVIEPYHLITEQLTMKMFDCVIFAITVTLAYFFELLLALGKI